MTDDDPLLRALRSLPSHVPPSNDAERARAAFVRASDPAPWLTKVTRGLVPAGLVSIVGLYLSWAFGVAIALNR